MNTETRRRTLGLLLIEIENLGQHGFSGLLCIGTDAGIAGDCCEDCPLIDLAPPEYRSAKSPCHHIPLNEKGETVESIGKSSEQGYLEAQLLRWMEATAERLKRELRDPSTCSLGSGRAEYGGKKVRRAFQPTSPGSERV
jgi:hypothetical protein